MKCKECRDFKFCLNEANRLGQIFDPEHESAYCFAPLSNAAHIRRMTDEELGEMFANFLSNTFKLNEIIAELEDAFVTDMIEWLKQPYKEKEK